MLTATVLGHDTEQFIGGSWVSSSSGETIDVTDAYTGEVMGRVPRGTTADVDAAVEAAARAFAEWSSTDVAVRADVLRRTAHILREGAEELADLVAREVGTPLSLANSIHVARPIEVMQSVADAAVQLPWNEPIENALVVREAVGVVAAITPWNVPLHQAIAKVAAALAAGCTVVLKPSEEAPFTAYAMALALQEAGIPNGVFNVISGYGAEVGPRLASHPLVDMISFTGSTAVGRTIGATAAGSVKRVALELGGKGPSIVLPGADVRAATMGTAARCFTNSGQVCAALSRLFVHRDSLAAAEETAAEAAAAFVLGDPRDPSTTMGPVISPKQKARVDSYLRAGADQGARLIAGGIDADVPEEGNFVAPTVFSDVSNDMTIAREEIFGPVLSILPYDDVEDAISMANDSEYGLVGAVWGPTVEEAARVASRLRVGMIGVNGGRINVRAPFGGFKQSGTGREFGTFGIEEFVEIKTVNFASAEAIDWPR